MAKYLKLQLKRILKIFPIIMAITLILFISFFAIGSGFIKNSNDESKNQKFKIALAGDTSDEYIKLGLAALQMLDDTRYAIDFLQMDEKDASSALEKGEISAYVVIPKNFIEEALYGNIKPIEYVTSPGNTGLIPMFKNEITRLITDIVVYSEKGVYGLEAAMTENGLGKHALSHMNQLNIDYLELILERSSVFEVEELGIPGGLSLGQHLVCGITVLFLMLIGLPYAVLFVRTDLSLPKLLTSKGVGSLKQLACEFVTLFVSILMTIFAVFGIASVLLLFIKTDIITLATLWTVFLALIPVILIISALDTLIFEISENLVSGVLLHFFTSVCLCYITGCFYPINSFPDVIQKISDFLPTGVARQFLSRCITGIDIPLQLGYLCAYSLILFAFAVVIRRIKTVSKRR